MSGAVVGFNSITVADGTNLVIVDQGPCDAAATIVLNHGWTQDHTSWEDVAAILAKTYRVISYDARGHGHSDAGPRGTGTLEQLAADLAEIITKFAPTGPIVLAGHSMGGPVLLAFIERYSEVVADRLRGVAFVATFASRIGRGFLGFSPAAVRAIVPIVDAVGGVRSLSPERRTTRFPRAIEELIRLGLYGPGNATRVNRRRTARQVARSHPATTGSLVRECIRQDRVHVLHELATTPTAVLCGTKDALSPLAYSREMAAALPAAKFVIYPGAGHMLPYEKSAEVAAEIAALIDRIEEGEN